MLKRGILVFHHYMGGRRSERYPTVVTASIILRALATWIELHLSKDQILTGNGEFSAAVGAGCRVSAHSHHNPPPALSFLRR
jgi:hypothetical protein